MALWAGVIFGTAFVGAPSCSSTSGGGAAEDGSGGGGAPTGDPCCIPVALSCDGSVPGYLPAISRADNGICITTKPECTVEKRYEGAPTPVEVFNLVDKEYGPNAWDMPADPNISLVWWADPGVNSFFWWPLASRDGKYVYVQQREQYPDDPSPQNGTPRKIRVLRIAIDGTSACSTLAPFHYNMRSFGLVRPDGAILLVHSVFGEFPWPSTCGKTYVTALSSDLIELWSEAFDGPVGGRPAVRSDNVLVVRTGAHISAIGAGGELLWRTRVEPEWVYDDCTVSLEGMSTDRFPYANDVAIDIHDNAYAITRAGSPGQSDPANDLVQLRPDGTLGWRLNGPHGREVVPEGDGTVVVPGLFNYPTVWVDERGTIVAATTADGFIERPVRAAATLPDGGVLMFAENFLVRITHDGLLWWVGNGSAHLGLSNRFPVTPGELGGGFLTEALTHVVVGFGVDRNVKRGALNAVSASDGSHVGEHLPFRGFEADVAIMLDDGMIVAPSNDLGGPLYAFTQPYGRLYPYGWPSSRSDAQLSGRERPRAPASP